MLSEGNAAHPVGCDSPLQIVMGLLAHHNCQQKAVTPNPERLNSNKKGAELPLHTICRGLSNPTGWAASALPQGVFFKGGETL